MTYGSRRLHSFPKLRRVSRLLSILLSRTFPPLISSLALSSAPTGKCLQKIQTQTALSRPSRLLWTPPAVLSCPESLNPIDRPRCFGLALTIVLAFVDFYALAAPFLGNSRYLRFLPFRLSLGHFGFSCYLLRGCDFSACHLLVFFCLMICTSHTSVVLSVA